MQKVYVSGVKSLRDACPNCLSDFWLFISEKSEYDYCVMLPHKQMQTLSLALHFC